VTTSALDLDSTAAAAAAGNAGRPSARPRRRRLPDPPAFEDGEELAVSLADSNGTAEGISSMVPLLDVPEINFQIANDLAASINTMWGHASNLSFDAIAQVADSTLQTPLFDSIVQDMALNSCACLFGFFFGTCAFSFRRLLQSGATIFSPKFVFLHASEQLAQR
jgi:hypothetical protein